MNEDLMSNLQPNDFCTFLTVSDCERMPSTMISVDPLLRGELFGPETELKERELTSPLSLKQRLTHSVPFSLFSFLSLLL